MNISLLDLGIIIFFILAIIHGYKKGLILSLALLIGLSLGVWGAKKFSDFAANYLYKNWQIDIPVLAFALTFIVILVLVFLLGKVLEKSMSLMALGWANKLGGILFALTKALIILLLVFHYYQKINNTKHWTNEDDFSISKTYPVLKAMDVYTIKLFDIIKNPEFKN